MLSISTSNSTVAEKGKLGKVRITMRIKKGNKDRISHAVSYVTRYIFYTENQRKEHVTLSVG